jgi:hypothetical protein
MATITVRGNRSANSRLFAKLEETEPRTERAIRLMWEGLGDDLKKRANEEILRKPKSGRLYIRLDRLGRRRRHRASAPGETHANMTGKLRKAIGWKIHGNNEGMTFGYGVSGRPSPKYDEFVEFGTRRMAARPSLSNAIFYTQASVETRLTDHMTREFGV